MSIFISIINFLIDLVVVICVFALGLLPQTPFKNVDFSQVDGLNILLYIIPVRQILIDFASLISALVIWYAARVLMRYIKMID